MRAPSTSGSKEKCDAPQKPRLSRDRSDVLVDDFVAVAALPQQRTALGLPGVARRARLRRAEIRGHQIIPVTNALDERRPKQLRELRARAAGVVRAIVGILHRRAKGRHAAALDGRTGAIDLPQE